MGLFSILDLRLVIAAKTGARAPDLQSKIPNQKSKTSSRSHRLAHPHDSLAYRPRLEAVAHAFDHADEVGQLHALDDEEADHAGQQAGGAVELAVGETEALRQVSRLRTPLKGLNFIASVAPLLGLLGTVIGMITCFESVADWGDTPGKSQRMAAGIKEALLTTAGGLSVAVPSLFVFFVFSQKLNLIVADCEGLATEFVHDLVRAEQGEPSPRRKPSRTRRKRPFISRFKDG